MTDVWADRVTKGFRPGAIEIRTDGLRDIVSRSREVVLLAAITGALTGVLVRYFEYFVAEVMFHRVLDGDWKWGLIVPTLGLAVS
ncbi:MAG: hypothetical protein ABJ381_00005, partial [Ilumatobacter sp.]|uniref:hypothetical protein n=1 Tax=Ilumatobacter sp. TaxID=1967498 RepID=UPI003297F036